MSTWQGHGLSKNWAKHYFCVCLWGCFWMRLTFESVGWVKQINLPRVGKHQFSCSVVSDSLRSHGLQHTRLSCPSSTPGACSNSCPQSWWCLPTISSSVMSPSPPALNLSQHQGLFQWVSSLHQVAKVLELQLQHQSFQWIFRTEFL